MPTKKPSSKELRAYQVVLNSKAKAAVFEKLMEAEVLENTITFRDGHSSQDELYSHRSGGKSRPAYVWIISRTPSIDGTFRNNLDAGAAFKTHKEKVEQFGSVIPL